MGNTRFLLRLGIIAGPFYLALGVLQGLLREGFDFSRHSLSVLANGPGGWLQTANFVLSGLMVIAAATGFRRVLAPDGRALSLILGGFGVGMLLGAVFPADPVDGFPPGTPLGFPTSISTPGLVHFAAGALGFTMLGLSGLAAAGVMSRRNERSLARLSFIAGVAVLLAFAGGFALGGAGILGIWLAVIVGWAWLAFMSLHLYRQVPGPN